MSTYGGICNTAISYFNLLGSIIMDEYELNPAGIVYPDAVARHIQAKGMLLTQTALKANIWVMDRLYHILKEMDKDYEPLDALNDADYIYNYYKDTSYTEYIFQVNMANIRSSMDRWQERFFFFEQKRDKNSAIFCYRMSETMAWGLATGQQVVQFKDTPSFQEYLDKNIGTYNRSLLDPSLSKYL